MDYDVILNRGDGLPVTKVPSLSHCSKKLTLFPLSSSFIVFPQEHKTQGLSQGLGIVHSHLDKIRVRFPNTEIKNFSNVSLVDAR